MRTLGRALHGVDDKAERAAILAACAARLSCARWVDFVGGVMVIGPLCAAATVGMSAFAAGGIGWHGPPAQLVRFITVSGSSVGLCLLWRWYWILRVLPGVLVERGRCAGCGYWLTPPIDTCPECGSRRVNVTPAADRERCWGAPVVFAWLAGIGQSFLTLMLLEELHVLPRLLVNLSAVPPEPREVWATLAVLQGLGGLLLFLHWFMLLRIDASGVRYRGITGRRVVAWEEIEEIAILGRNQGWRAEVKVAGGGKFTIDSATLCFATEALRVLAAAAERWAPGAVVRGQERLPKSGTVGDETPKQVSTEDAGRDEARGE